MLANRLAAAALAAAALAFAAPASQAATVSPDVTFSFEFTAGQTGQRTLMGGVFFPTEQVPVVTRIVEFQIKNSTGDSWKSFVLDAPSPPPVTFSNFDGPAGSFGAITDFNASGDPEVTIGGLHVASGDTLTFLLNINRSLASVTSVGLYGAPSTTPIPLPAAAWLLLGGLGALGAVARRKRAA